MKKDLLADYLGYLSFRLLGATIKILPFSLTLFLGRLLGDFLYYLDFKHKALVYSNIKTAFGKELSTHKLNRLTHEFYLSFGQSLMEIFLIPSINKEYLNKYISFQGLEFIDEAFKRGKGVILLGVHAGSWELSNIICANLGFPFSLYVRNQRHSRLDNLLNSYRRKKGCKIIERENQTRELIEAIKRNEAIGMTADQGGAAGELVKFFGKDASMATGAVRLALKYGSLILPSFYTRVKGPYMKTIIGSPFEVKRTGNTQKDIRENLQEIARIFEKNIKRHAKDYLWSYKIWKYSKEKNVLILSDGKAGHLRQAQALARILGACLKERIETVNIDTLELKFKNTFAKRATVFSSCLAGKYQCQGCLWCLRAFLDNDTYKSLSAASPDIIISCGASSAPVNYVLSRQNLAKSIVIMRPSILSTKRFNLVIIPRHDNPPARKNVIATEGALNLIDEKYLKEQSEALMQSSGLKVPGPGPCIGLLIGGDTKNFPLDEAVILAVIQQVKSAAEKLDAQILVTTSRRTSYAVEQLVKKEFGDYPRCKFLVIANEKNPPFTVGGILGLAQVIITSCESISMISEAVSSKKYVLVFQSRGQDRRHQEFLRHYAENKYIYLAKSPFDLSRSIEDIWLRKPPIYTTKDNLLVSEAVKKIL